MKQSDLGNESMKRAELDPAYGAFREKEPCFPDDSRHLTIPKNISVIDRVVATQLNFKRRKCCFMQDFIVTNVLT